MRFLSCLSDANAAGLVGNYMGRNRSLMHMLKKLGSCLYHRTRYVITVHNMPYIIGTDYPQVLVADDFK
jgi:hypothetical protein